VKTKHSTFKAIEIQVLTRWLSFAALKEMMDHPTALDDAMCLVAGDLDFLMRDGLALQFPRGKVTLRLAVIGIKGDWPFLIASGHLERHFRRAPKRGESTMQAAGVCHLCLAGFEGFPFEDFRQDAKWESTMLSAAAQAPWESVPSWANFPGLPGFKPFNFRPDLFHGWHLGAGRYFVSSSLVILMAFEDAGGQTGVDARLAAMTERWVQYCKDRKDSWLHLMPVSELSMLILSGFT